MAETRGLHRATLLSVLGGSEVPGAGSIVIRRNLGRTLQELRVKAHKSSKDVETAGIMSKPNLSRLERGKIPARPSFVRDLCRIYGVDQATTDLLVARALGTKGTPNGWLEAYDSNSVPEWFLLYLDLEQIADGLTTYNPELVHGLLQTEPYMRAVYMAAQPDEGEEAIQQRVDRRLKRQRRILGRSNPVTIVAILNAGVISREVGGADVMTGQVDHLRNLAELANVDVFVLPFTAGAHAAMTGGYTMFEVNDPDDPTVVYHESEFDGRYHEDPGQITRYRRVTDLLLEHSIPMKEF
jgi:transcriptional regulator with XRE-family HTH domain